MGEQWMSLLVGEQWMRLLGRWAVDKTASG